MGALATYNYIRRWYCSDGPLLCDKGSRLWSVWEETLFRAIICLSKEAYVQVLLGHGLCGNDYFSCDYMSIERSLCIVRSFCQNGHNKFRQSVNSGDSQYRYRCDIARIVEWVHYEGLLFGVVLMTAVNRPQDLDPSIRPRASSLQQAWDSSRRSIWYYSRKHSKTLQKTSYAKFSLSLRSWMEKNVTQRRSGVQVSFSWNGLYGVGK